MTKILIFALAAAFSVSSMAQSLFTFPTKFLCQDVSGQYQLRLNLDANHLVAGTLKVGYRDMKAELLKVTIDREPNGGVRRPETQISFSILFQIISDEEMASKWKGAVLNLFTNEKIDFVINLGRHFFSAYLGRYTSLTDSTLVGPPLLVGCRYDVDVSPDW